jgi:hypothetical protein
MTAKTWYGISFRVRMTAKTWYGQQRPDTNRKPRSSSQNDDQLREAAPSCNADQAGWPDKVRLVCTSGYTSWIPLRFSDDISSSICR